MGCPCCKAVSFLCRWQPRPRMVWRRPVLVVLSLLAVLGAPVLASASGWSAICLPGYSVGWETFLLGVVASGAIGLIVAWRGCDACVGRVCPL